MADTQLEAWLEALLSVVAACDAAALQELFLDAPLEGHVTRERIVAGLWETLTDELRRSFGRSSEPSGADATSSALRFQAELANALRHIAQFDTAAQVLVSARRGMLQSNLQTYVDEARTDAYEWRRRKQEQDYNEAQDRHGKAMWELKVCAENFVPGCSAYYASHPGVSLDDRAVDMMRRLFATANKHGISLPSPESLIEFRNTAIEVRLGKIFPSAGALPVDDLELIILEIVLPGRDIPLLKMNKAQFNVKSPASGKLTGWKFEVPEGFSERCKFKFHLQYKVWVEKADSDLGDMLKTGASMTSVITLGLADARARDYIKTSVSCQFSSPELPTNPELRVSNLPGKPGVELLFVLTLHTQTFWKGPPSCKAATAKPIMNSNYDLDEALKSPYLRNVAKPLFDFFKGQSPEEMQKEANAQIEKQCREDQQNLEAAELSKLLEDLKCRCGVVRDGVDAFCNALDASASRDARSLLQVCRIIATWPICCV
jgi:hypothetical protein